jgi:hypothetical protein
MLRNQPRPKIVDIACGISGDDSDGFALKIGLRVGDANLIKQETNSEYERLHADPPGTVIADSPPSAVPSYYKALGAATAAAHAPCFALTGRR